MRGAGCLWACSSTSASLEASVCLFLGVSPGCSPGWCCGNACQPARSHRVAVRRPCASRSCAGSSAFNLCLEPFAGCDWKSSSWCFLCLILTYVVGLWVMHCVPFEKWDVAGVGCTRVTSGLCVQLAAHRPSWHLVLGSFALFSKSLSFLLCPCCH